MAEETKQEINKSEEKKEEKAEEKNEEDKADQDKKEEPKKPAAPFVLLVDLHCMGCAKKIRNSILKIRGVEGVSIDMSKNEVTIKGVVEPQAVCGRIMKKTKRRAKVLSPLPEAEGEPMPEVVASQVTGLTTVELNVNMHCEACAQQLKKKILKMKGVRTAETEPSSGKVTVTGTMDAERLVDYVYRRTKKQAKIVPQPESEKPTEESPKNEEKKKDEKTAAAEGEAKPEEVKKENGEKKDPPPPEEEKRDGDGEAKEEASSEEEPSMHKMMYHYNSIYQPLYMIERIPAPQLFSDENPNACNIM
ncbi:Heavy metal-associated isoprenylated plant protein 9 [Orobanche gracilis]